MADSIRDWSEACVGRSYVSNKLLSPTANFLQFLAAGQVSWSLAFHSFWVTGDPGLMGPIRGSLSGPFGKGSKMNLRGLTLFSSVHSIEDMWRKLPDLILNGTYLNFDRLPKSQTKLGALHFI